MNGYHIILANGQRYPAAGGSPPKVGEIIAGFVVRRVAGTDVYVDMPKTTAEWRDYAQWERERTNGMKKKGVARTLRPRSSSPETGGNMESPELQGKSRND